MLVRAEIPGGWDMARELMGEELACLAYYEQPELMQDILDTLRETSVRVLGASHAAVGDRPAVRSRGHGGQERTADRPRPGAAVRRTVLPGVLGSRLQPRHAAVQPGQRRQYEPGARRVSGMRRQRDASLRAGRRHGHGATRQKYGRRLAILGGIDKHVLRRTKEEIRRELEYKMQPLMRQGGTVFGLDHRIPNGTPLENYRYYVALGREILGLPPLDGQSRGWGRMAF